MNRRHFVRTVLAGATALATGAWTALRPPCSLRARETLEGWVADPTRAAELGRAWLAAGGGREPIAIPASRSAFARQVDRDFEEGRTVDVEGWQLARSELALCVRLASRPRSRARARAARVVARQVGR